MYLYSNVYLNDLVLAVAGIRAGVRPSPEPSLPDASSLHLPYDLCFASWIWDLLDFAFQLCIYSDSDLGWYGGETRAV